MTDHQTFKPISMNMTNAECNAIPTRGPLTTLKEDNWLLVDRVDKMIKTVTVLSERLVGYSQALEKKDPSENKQAIPDGVFHNIGAFQNQMKHQFTILEDKLEQLVKHTE